MDAVQIGPSYAVGWGTLALINAGLAQSKGRSRLAWFLVSLVLGPIATFYRRHRSLKTKLQPYGNHRLLGIGGDATSTAGCHCWLVQQCLLIALPFWHGLPTVPVV